MSKNGAPTKTDPLLQPFRLKHLTFRNRIISTAHEPGYADRGMPAERYQAYHEERAKGGLAAAYTGAADIAPESNSHHNDLYMGTDEVVPYLHKLGERVRKHGAYMFCQLAHRGWRDNFARGSWLPSIAPSCVRERSHRNFPKRMEGWDFDRVYGQYAAAARRCIDARMDGIELAAYGHLMDSFWSPFTNLRNDAYGGSIENRMRFGMEVLRAIRSEIGMEPVLGLRMVVDDARPLGRGLQFPEGLEIAQRYAESGMIDYLNIVVGHIDTDEGLHHMIPPMGTPTAPHLDQAAEVKRHVSIPVFHAGRMGDVSTARHAIGEGLIDIVGMTRAHIADPYIVRKIEQGQEDRIRPCVGAGYCIDNIYVGGHSLCMHNGATGHEARLPHVIERSDTPGKKIVVVGAGPAGLEAARVCASRGHNVVMFEAADRPGGQIQLMATINRRREIIGIVDWLYREVQELGVDIRFNCFAERDEVVRENPDIVVIATGGVPDAGFLDEGASLVTSSWDIVSGAVPVAGNVLIYDDNGQHPAMTCMEYICANKEDVKLEIATCDRLLGQDIGGSNYPPYYRVMYEHDVTILPNHELIAVKQRGNILAAQLFNEYTGEIIEREVAQVVVEHGTIPMDKIYYDLVDSSLNLGDVSQDDLLRGRPQNNILNPEGAFMLFRVGDAISSRDIHGAVHDALRLCHCW